MMRGLKTCTPFLLLMFLSLSCFCCNLSEARLRVQRHPSAVVVGTVYCHTCFQHDVSKSTDYIPGATVAVECVEGSTRQAFYQEVNTNKKGNFKVDLPFSVSKHVKDIQGCTVKLVKSNQPYCAVASTSTSSRIHLKERKGGQHIYSAGFFTFKPLKQPDLCNQQSSVTNSKLNSLGDTLPGLPTPQIPNLPMPDIPTLPVPEIPTLPVTNPLTPTIPGAPLLPNVPLPPLPPLSEKPIVPTKDSKVANELVSRPQGLFPPLIPPVISPPSSGLPIPDPLSPAPLLPNPLQPPPSPLIPNPFQPPTPPAGLVPQLPPLPTIPIVPGIPGIPAVPGLTPPTPSPSPVGIVPTLPPLPTIPVVPGIPGVPALTPPTPSPSPVGIVPTLPPLPTIPVVPGIPGVPALTPPTPFPQPPATLLPPLLPPGIPGLPPAKLKTVNP